MERATLTLQGVQLEAALDRARGLVVLPGSRFSPGRRLLRPQGLQAAPPPTTRSGGLGYALPPPLFRVTGAQPLTLPLRRAVHARPPAARRPRQVSPPRASPASALPTAAVEVGFPSCSTHPFLGQDPGAQTASPFGREI